jgi:cytochrome c556
MNMNSTNTEFRAIKFRIPFTIFVFIVLLSIASCSTGFEQNGISNQTSSLGDKSFSFKEKGSEWTVDFEKNDIAAVYKDGARLPDGEIEEYREMIYDKIDELKSDQDRLTSNVYRFNFDADQFNDLMKQLKEDFDNDKFMHFKLEFDDDEFNKNMEDLEEKLSDLKDKKIEIYFDSEKFKENMKELEENLKDFPIPPVPPNIDIDIHLNMEKFKENMKKFGEEFKLHNFKIDSSDFDMKNLRESMKELKRNMKDLRVDMHDLKGEMKNLNEFLADLKTELVMDGYIGSVDEEFDLAMSLDKTEINGTPVKQVDHNKYKEIYKKHFNKEIDGTFKIKKD